MNELGQYIINSIKEDVKNGLTLEESANKQGLKRWCENEPIYYIPVGTYDDKVLLFNLNPKKVTS